MPDTTAPVDRSRITHLDPRARLTATTAAALLIAVSQNLPTLFSALLAAVLLSVAAQLPAREFFHRLARLNGMLLFLWIILPWSASGAPTGSTWFLPLSTEGARLALTISLKGNAIVLLFTALISTIPPSELGQALHHLRCPHKLIHLFMLVSSYTGLLREENARLQLAAGARAFHPRFSRHTLRTLGHLVGMLLVHSLERSERTLAAMQCRGFDGRFHSLTVFKLRRNDHVFLALALVHSVLWMYLEWFCKV